MSTIEFLMTDIFAFGLVFSRLSGFVLTAPFVREEYIPPRFRILGIILFSALLFRSVTVDIQTLEYGEFVFIGMIEFGIGAVLGFAIDLIFNAIRSAGGQMAQMIGLRFHMIDTGDEPIGLGELFMIFTAFLVVSSGGDRYFINTFIDLYQVIPIGSYQIAFSSANPVFEFGSIFIMAVVKLSLPIIAVVLTFYLLAGIFEHFFSQWDIFALVFPGAIFIGLWSLTLLAPHIVLQGSEMITETINSIGQIF